MSKINYQALREAAEKALHGEWGYEAGAIWNTCDSGYVQHMAAVEAGDEVSDEEHMSNMRFITLATPTVVLGLLDELSEAKAAEENESSCANSVIDIAINWQMRAKDAEAKLEAAEKRIAELEAEPVSQTYKLNELSGNYPVTPDGWISCSERMPAQDDWILIYSKHGEYMAGQVQGEYVELSDGTLSWLGNALYWMPLPEPPQEVN